MCTRGWKVRCESICMRRNFFLFWGDGVSQADLPNFFVGNYHSDKDGAQEFYGLKHIYSL